MDNLGKLQAESGGQPWQWTYLVHDGAQASRTVFPEVKIETLETTDSGLLAQLENLQVKTIFLQYVGYGYANDGAPLVLCQSLSKWRNNSADRRLIVMFHEVFSHGMPWQRVFWQVPKQKRSVSTLLDAASTVVTSMQPNANSIHALRPHIPIKIIPIGSSFSASAPSKRNWKQLLIFGKQYARVRALKAHKQLLEQLVSEHLIDTIVLAGECTNVDDDRAEFLLRSWNLPVKIVTAYNFAANDIADEISTSALSLMHTQSSNLLKSTSFQLAAQLGQVAIARRELEMEPPFRAGRHYLSYTDNDMTDLLHCLHDAGRRQQISQTMAQAGKDNLSWQHIAQSWREILQAAK
jgi:hypothetical protein